MKNTILTKYVYDFSVDYDWGWWYFGYKWIFNEKQDIIMFGFIFKMSIGLSSISTTGLFGKSLVSNSQGPKKRLTVNNRPCQARSTLININSNKTLFSIYF